MSSIPALDIGTSLNAIGSAQNTAAQAALKGKGNARAAAENFEAMFLNSMFQEMFTGINGDGPFGGSGALKVWRSFLTDQYAKSFAKAGGIGIANEIYQTLLQQQGAHAS